MRISFLAAFCGVVMFPALGRTQSAADSAGIRAAALDYIDGWYAADGARMERALHPELAKRNVTSDSTGRSRLIQMSAMTLVQGTRSGGGSSIGLPHAIERLHEKPGSRIVGRESECGGEMMRPRWC